MKVTSNGCDSKVGGIQGTEYENKETQNQDRAMVTKVGMCFVWIHRLEKKAT